MLALPLRSWVGNVEKTRNHQQSTSLHGQIRQKPLHLVGDLEETRKQDSLVE